MKQDKEVWLRGTLVNGITPLLQPVAHALLQAEEELHFITTDLKNEWLWLKPAGCASPGFHLLHIGGVLDRLLTYAEGNALSNEQLAYLSAETQTHAFTTNELLEKCKAEIKRAIERLKYFSAGMLEDKKSVGRAALPSTVTGLCTHAAEHTMRHVGQLLVTVKVIHHGSFSEK